MTLEKIAQPLEHAVPLAVAVSNQEHTVSGEYNYIRILGTPDGEFIVHSHVDPETLQGLNGFYTRCEKEAWKEFSKRVGFGGEA